MTKYGHFVDIRKNSVVVLTMVLGYTKVARNHMRS